MVSPDKPSGHPFTDKISFLGASGIVKLVKLRHKHEDLNLDSQDPAKFRYGKVHL